jgi:mRNA-degrading endonuclease toxin of MazEF toxin-antitoxin module
VTVDRGTVVLVELDPKRRVRRVFGRVSASELAAIDQGLELFLSLGTRP